MSSTKEDRKARRVGMSCRLFFFGDDDFEGEAQLLDLSSTGCMARSMEPLQVGRKLKLSLFLPDGHAWPVRVEEAVVRWVRDCNCGFEFLSIRPPQLLRVQQAIMKKRR
ncbi:MAG TPA: PilZ domain-containing protein [Nitrospiraceae bacterium]|nr:PilZ domain-containing protein [Nitrospiraceae bacterium]